jgi:hypothetical protein
VAFTGSSPDAYVTTDYDVGSCFRRQSGVRAPLPRDVTVAKIIPPRIIATRRVRALWQADPPRREFVRSAPNSPAVTAGIIAHKLSMLGCHKQE